MDTGTCVHDRMPIATGALLLIAVCSALGAEACATTPIARATETESLQCEPKSARGIETVEQLSVLSVSPLWVHIHSSTMGDEVRVTGAKLLVRPPEGVDVERLLRSLQCHAARIVLGREGPADPHDPFWLAGTWLEIGVETERGNYAVSIAADTIDQGLRVLTEAKAFARGHVERTTVQP
jgi:hypothetical protein